MVVKIHENTQTHTHTHTSSKHFHNPYMIRVKGRTVLYFTHKPTHIQQQNPKNRKAHTNSMVRIGVSHAHKLISSESHESEILQMRM